MKKQLRLIGGTHNGDVYSVDKDIPVFKLPTRTKIGNAPMKPNDPVMPKTIELEIYFVHDFGGDYLYGIFHPLIIADILDKVWQGAKPRHRYDPKNWSPA